jgi:opacity protein-like surface antigen
MKRIFLTLLCAFGLMSSMNPAMAQSQSKVKSAINTITPDWMPPFKLGVTAGFNASTFSHDGYNNLCGFQVGLDAMVDMSSLLNNTYLRTGLQVVRKGAKYDFTYISEGYNTTVDVETKYRPVYLQIPIRYGFGYVLETDCVFFGELGPYVAVGVGGKSRTTQELFDQEYKSSTSFFDHADRFDLGFGFHAGVILCKYHQVSLGYDFGLLNMSDNYAQNRSFMLSYTYFFK